LDLLALSEDFDNKAASLAKLVRKLTHAYSLPADSQAIELHKSGIVQLDRDARPESVIWPLHRRDDRLSSVAEGSNTRSEGID
jgi:hypothetical protein